MFARLWKRIHDFPLCFIQGMLGQISKRFLLFVPYWSSMDDFSEPNVRYRMLRRNLMILMVTVTVLPLIIMAFINHHQYQKALKSEIVQPIRILLNKTKHSFEIFLAERVSAVSFIASAYSFEDLADAKTLNRIFRVTTEEFKGFVDLGLIDISGLQVSYAGPYDLSGKSYEDQNWFHEVTVRGDYISDVFMGYRKFPHIVIAVLKRPEDGRPWILRATIDTSMFDKLIAAMGLAPDGDAFLMNYDGVLQTRSKFYGNVLDKCPIDFTPMSYETNVVNRVDSSGRQVLIAYTYFTQPAYILAVVYPKAEVLQSWYTLKSEIFFLFIGSVVVILFLIYRLSDVMVRRIRESDEKREEAFREMEHTHKLSSIGRLAAGVAHEVNNPMAIINEKAGLMKDLVAYSENFPQKDKFLNLVQSILQSVERCSNITHRLLGFARRMEVEIETLNVNDVITEVLSFLEKETLYRNIQIRPQLAEDLPRISSDHGQLQQVFLNILNNAIAAVYDGGLISVTSWEPDQDTVAVSIQDNGCGMSEETLKNIFEPFFTTKKEYGTGLGLSITYGIIKKMGGDIKVQSKKNEGSTFTVYLPRKPN